MFINNRCCYCGRFVPWGADWSVPYGSYNDIEEPDAEYYCNNCIKRQTQKRISANDKPHEWQLANWQIAVIKAIEAKETR